MAKKKQLKVQEEEVYFDDYPFGNDADDGMMAGVMSGMLEASNNQMHMALELTKLIVSERTLNRREN